MDNGGVKGININSSICIDKVIYIDKVCKFDNLIMTFCSTQTYMSLLSR